MVLEYDFDIVVNEELEDDAGSERLDMSVARARFRHVKTADALRATSPKIRKIFQNAGFDLDSTNSDMTHGFFAGGDVAERERILRALFTNIRAAGISGEYCGEFDFHQFLEDVKTAKPHVDQRRQVADWTPNPRYKSPATPERRSILGRIGFALGLAVILFAILRYLAAAGATP